MTVHIKNIMAFLEKHDEIPEERRKEIIKAAEEKAGEMGLILGGAAEEILGNLSGQFFSEIHGSDQEKHAVLWFEEITKKKH